MEEWKIGIKGEESTMRRGKRSNSSKDGREEYEEKVRDRGWKNMKEWRWDTKEGREEEFE